MGFVIRHHPTERRPEHPDEELFHLVTLQFFV